MSVKTQNPETTLDKVRYESFGVYCYVEIETGEVIYIGYDSHIERNQRHKDHIKKSVKNIQSINVELQTNPDKYIYKVIAVVASKEVMQILEASLIAEFDPKFNDKQYNKKNIRD